MFTNPKGFFCGDDSLQLDKDGNLTEQDLHLAAVALLVEAAMADECFSEDELDTILNGVVEEFGVDKKEATDLLDVARFSRRQPDKLDQFVGVVNKYFDIAQKQRLLSLVWKVIAADGEVDFAEAGMASRLRVRLGLSLEQAVRAQQLGQN